MICSVPGRSALATTYHVNPQAGNDSRSPAEATNATTPWKTLKKALSHSGLAPGDVISMSAGVYSTGSGEVFPITLREGVELRGIGNTTQVVAPRDTDVFSVDNQDMSDPAGLYNMSLEAASSGGYGAGLRVTLTDADVTMRMEAVRVTSSLLYGVRFSAVGDGDMSFAPTIIGSTFSTTGPALQLNVSSGMSGEVSPLFTNNTYSGQFIAVQGSFEAAGALVVSPVVSGNQLTSGRGLVSMGLTQFSGGEAQVFTPTIRDNLVAGMASNGLGVVLAVLKADDSLGEEKVTFSPLVVGNSISGGQNGIQIGLSGIDGGVLVANATVAGNAITSADSVGLLMSAYSFGDGPSTVDATVFNNTVSLSGQGIEVIMSGNSGAAGKIDIDVSGNVISDSTSEALRIQQRESPDLRRPMDVILAGNVVDGSAGDGVAAYMKGLDNLSAYTMLISDNYVTSCASRGLYLDQEDVAFEPSSVTGNTFTQNGVGAYVRGGLTNAAHTADPPSLGTAAEPGHNRFDGNSGFALVSELTEPMQASGNFWGPTSTGAIDALISDDEEKGAGAVNFQTPLTTAPSRTILSQLGWEILEDTGLPGPTPGDSLLVTASLQGTGQQGCAAVSFETQSPNTVERVIPSARVSQGLLLEEDPDLRALLKWLAPGQRIEVEWTVVIGEDPTCPDVVMQGQFNCQPLGGQLTDDPTSAAAEDATVVKQSRVTFYRDADADGFGDDEAELSTCLDPGEGFVTVGGDCDDNDPTSRPGEVEVCDGADNNCDGQTDEGVLLDWYVDADLDGFGDDASVKAACTQPQGYSATNTDCNDAQPLSNPGEDEVCDGLDNNCDGVTDEGLTSLFYRDVDEDGFGDAAQPAEACDQPQGYVADASDCDDRDGTRYPGNDEICDEKDNNCDGDVDEGVEFTFYEDADADNYGNPNEPSTGCEAPLGYVDNADDCRDTDANINPEADEVCDGRDNNCDGAVDPSGSEGEVTFYADVDQDGYGDPDATAESCEEIDGYVTDDQDCDDTSEDVFPGAPEVAYDGIDQDCDGEDLTDADGDTFDSDEVEGGEDCDDSDEVINPAALEVEDGKDNNCDGRIDEGFEDYDVDNDGHESVDQGGDDCDDADPAVYPGAEEVCGDSLDNNCDGEAETTELCGTPVPVGNGACGGCSSAGGEGGGAWLSLVGLFLATRRRLRVGA